MQEAHGQNLHHHHDVVLLLPPPAMPSPVLLLLPPPSPPAPTAATVAHIPPLVRSASAREESEPAGQEEVDPTLRLQQGVVSRETCVHGPSKSCPLDEAPRDDEEGVHPRRILPLVDTVADQKGGAINPHEEIVDAAPMSYVCPRDEKLVQEEADEQRVMAELYADFLLTIKNGTAKSSLKSQEFGKARSATPHSSDGLDGFFRLLTTRKEEEPRISTTSSLDSQQQQQQHRSPAARDVVVVETAAGKEPALVVPPPASMATPPAARPLGIPTQLVPSPEIAAIRMQNFLEDWYRSQQEQVDKKKNNHHHHNKDSRSLPPPPPPCRHSRPQYYDGRPRQHDDDGHRQQQRVDHNKNKHDVDEQQAAAAAAAVLPREGRRHPHHQVQALDDIFKATGTLIPPPHQQPGCAPSPPPLGAAGSNKETPFVPPSEISKEMSASKRRRLNKKKNKKLRQHLVTCSDQPAPQDQEAKGELIGSLPQHVMQTSGLPPGRQFPLVKTDHQAEEGEAVRDSSPHVTLTFLTALPSGKVAAMEAAAEERDLLLQGNLHDHLSVNSPHDAALAALLVHQDQEMEQSEPTTMDSSKAPTLPTVQEEGEACFGKVSHGDAVDGEEEKVLRREKQREQQDNHQPAGSVVMPTNPHEMLNLHETGKDDLHDGCLDDNAAVQREITRDSAAPSPSVTDAQQAIEVPPAAAASNSLSPPPPPPTTSSKVFISVLTPEQKQALRSQSLALDEPPLSSHDDQHSSSSPRPPPEDYVAWALHGGGGGVVEATTSTSRFAHRRRQEGCDISPPVPPPPSKGYHMNPTQPPLAGTPPTRLPTYYPPSTGVGIAARSHSQPPTVAAAPPPYVAPPPLPHHKSRPQALDGPTPGATSVRDLASQQQRESSKARDFGRIAEEAQRYKSILSLQERCSPPSSPCSAQLAGGSPSSLDKKDPLASLVNLGGGGSWMPPAISSTCPPHYSEEWITNYKVLAASNPDFSMLSQMTDTLCDSCDKVMPIVFIHPLERARYCAVCATITNCFERCDGNIREGEEEEDGGAEKGENFMMTEKEQRGDRLSSHRNEHREEEHGTHFMASANGKPRTSSFRSAHDAGEQEWLAAKQVARRNNKRKKHKGEVDSWDSDKDLSYLDEEKEDGQAPLLVQQQQAELLDIAMRRENSNKESALLLRQSSTSIHGLEGKVDKDVSNPAAMEDTEPSEPPEEKKEHAPSSGTDDDDAKGEERQLEWSSAMTRADRKDVAHTDTPPPVITATAMASKNGKSEARGNIMPNEVPTFFSSFEFKKTECFLCGLECGSRKNLEIHCKSKRHLRKLAQKHSTTYRYQEALIKKYEGLLTSPPLCVHVPPATIDRLPMLAFMNRMKRYEEVLLGGDGGSRSSIERFESLEQSLQRLLLVLRQEQQHRSPHLPPLIPAAQASLRLASNDVPPSSVTWQLPPSDVAVVKKSSPVAPPLDNGGAMLPVAEVLSVNQHLRCRVEADLYGGFCIRITPTILPTFPGGDAPSVSFSSMFTQVQSPSPPAASPPPPPPSPPLAPPAASSRIHGMPSPPQHTVFPTYSQATGRPPMYAPIPPEDDPRDAATSIARQVMDLQRDIDEHPLSYIKCVCEETMSDHDRQLFQHELNTEQWFGFDTETAPRVFFPHVHANLSQLRRCGSLAGNFDDSSLLAPATERNGYLGGPHLIQIATSKHVWLYSTVSQELADQANGILSPYPSLFALGAAPAAVASPAGASATDGVSSPSIHADFLPTGAEQRRQLQALDDAIEAQDQRCNFHEELQTKAKAQTEQDFLEKAATDMEGMPDEILQSLLGQQQQQQGRDHGGVTHAQLPEEEANRNLSPAAEEAAASASPIPIPSKVAGGVLPLSTTTTASPPPSVSSSSLLLHKVSVAKRHAEFMQRNHWQRQQHQQHVNTSPPTEANTPKPFLLPSYLETFFKRKDIALVGFALQEDKKLIRDMFRHQRPSPTAVAAVGCDGGQSQQQEPSSNLQDFASLVDLSLMFQTRVSRMPSALEPVLGHHDNPHHLPQHHPDDVSVLLSDRSIAASRRQSGDGLTTFDVHNSITVPAHVVDGKPCSIVQACARVYKRRFDKDKAITVSNWAVGPRRLTIPQRLYAAKDALIPLMILKEIERRHQRRQ